MYHWSRRQRLVRSVMEDPDAPTPRETRVTPHANPLPPSEEVLELTAAHAAGFVIMASTSLLVLFYFKIYGIVKVFYAMGCSIAMAQVIFVPLYDACLRYGCFDARYRRGVVVWRTNTEDFGDITVRDIVTHMAGLMFGIAWLVIAFTHHDAENITFFWVMQDVFGACMCVSFLKTIRLNNIRVASILLVVAFFYDIFFVFITPQLFGGKSVMITVATSGGPPKADPLWCEKYPNDPDCQGGNPLPMLLAIPKLFDYMGGSSLLGLGDIVLPGLLLSFAARYDAAKVLLSVLGGGRASANQSYSCPEQRCCTGFLPPKCGAMLCSGGYFGPLMVAYAIGLAMANIAVYVMSMGQPALLYLVPCCLGTTLYIGWRRNELSQLWEGPRVLISADSALCRNDSLSAGEVSISSSPSSNLHTPIPLEEGHDTGDILTAPPSAVDDA
jgi:signal peptide peptidase-like protein 2B